MPGKGWKWLEMARNGLKWLEIAGKGWKRLEMATMAGNGWNG